jgi:serine phosphatase RsbU (regulator of sigma subunit)
MKYLRVIPALCAAVCVISFLWIWFPVARYLVLPFEKLAEDVAPLDLECLHASAPWEAVGKSFETAQRMELAQQKVRIPLPIGYPVSAELDHMRRYRCIIDLRLDGSAREAVSLFVPIVQGDTAFFVNGKFRGYIPTRGPLATTLTSEESHGQITLDVISRRVAAEFAPTGLTVQTPIFVATKAGSVKELVRSIFGFRGTMDRGRIDVCLVLVLILGGAWASGMRYNDVGWLLLLTASLCAQSVVSLRSEWMTTELGWCVYQLSYVAGAMAVVGFSLAFLRVKELEKRFRVLALPIGFGLAGGLYAAEKLLWHSRSYFVVGMAIFLALALFVFLVKAVKSSQVTEGQRRRNLRIFAFLTLMAGCGYAIQAVGRIYQWGVIGPFIQPAVALAFGVFLGADLVLFQRRTLSERQMRQTFEVRNQVIFDQMTLGQSIQNLLVKPFTLLDSPLAICAFSYRPHIHLAGDWASIWESDAGLCVIAGDVSGKGAPAALAMSSIMGFMQQVKHRRLAMAEALDALNRSASQLLRGNLMSTWTGLVVDQKQDLTIGSAGSVGWFVWDGAKIRHYATRSEILGVQEVIAPVFKKVEAKDWKIALTVSDGICATGRAMKLVSDRLSTLLNAGSSDAEIMDAMYVLAKDAEIPDDQSVIIVRQKQL